MESNRVAQLALHFVPHIGNFLIKQLISYCGSAERVFKAPKNKLLKVPGIGDVAANAILKQRPLERARAEFEKAQKDDVKILFHSDKDYPTRLKQINDAPSILYVKGVNNLESNKMVGIVGTRNATDYGKSFTSELVESLMAHKVIIVSGLAYGIDIEAHKSAIKNELPTIGVMAGGINKIYPSAHRKVAEDMQLTGAIITEQSYDSVPDAPKFPARNRIIAGLCDVIIVVEAASKGGALITANIANDYNRDVFAVPGDLNRKYSEGCNNLIKQNKAHLLTGIQDIEYIMNWDASDQVPKQSVLHLDLFNDQEQSVIETLRDQNEGVHIDKLSWVTQIPVNNLASILLALEFQGHIKSLPGKKYKMN
ncbi:MAG: DNA-processing protein DprA [Bacteroidota bacterium]